MSTPTYRCTNNDALMMGLKHDEVSVDASSVWLEDDDNELCSELYRYRQEGCSWLKCCYSSSEVREGE